jgi:hypothetical protein
MPPDAQTSKLMRGHAPPPKIADTFMAPERNVQFSGPTWLRNLDFSSWRLVGFVLIIVALI